MKEPESNSHRRSKTILLAWAITFALGVIAEIAFQDLQPVMGDALILISAGAGAAVIVSEFIKSSY